MAESTARVFAELVECPSTEPNTLRKLASVTPKDSSVDTRTPPKNQCSSVIAKHRFVLTLAGILLAVISGCTQDDSAIFDALAREDTAAVQQLASAPANLRAVDSDGATPLMRAIHDGRVDMVAILLDHGADIEASCAVAAGMLSNFIRVDGADRISLTPLMLAAMLADATILRALLDRGASLQGTGEKELTALHTAAAAGRTDAVRLLLERGAAIDARSRDGALAIDVAMAMDRTATVSELQAHSKDAPPRLVDVLGHHAVAEAPEHGSKDSAWIVGTLPVGIAAGNDGTVYWSQYRTSTVNQVGADGTNPEVLATVDGPLGLAFDNQNARVWFVSDRNFPRSIGFIDLATGLPQLAWEIRTHRPFDVATSPEGVFWTEAINGRIRRAAFDGSDIATIYDDGISSANERPGAIPMNADGIIVDTARGFIFWTDSIGSQIVRLRLPDGQPQVILGREDGVVLPTALAVDRTKGILYWADPGTESIRRATYSGSRPEVVADASDGVLEPYGLTIDQDRRLLYWTELGKNEIRRTPLDRRQAVRFLDLTAPDDITQPSTDACALGGATLRRVFLDRWVKVVRTCLQQSEALKAVQRQSHGMRPAGRICAGELTRLGSRSTVLRNIARACSGKSAKVVLDENERLAARILATYFPRAKDWLRAVRPFTVEQLPPDTRATEEALAWIDTLAARLAEFDDRPDTKLPWTLPATGQATHFHAIRSHSANDGPVHVLDDGTLRTGDEMSFVDNGDGTITDRSTGLIWEKKCAGCGGMHDVDESLPLQAQNGGLDVGHWLAEMNAKDGRGFAGYSDWRLPTAIELLNIIDYERFNPAVAPAFDGELCGIDCDDLTDRNCSCTRFNKYWSSTATGNQTSKGTVVTFNLGLLQHHPKDETAYVRAVRGPQISLPKPRFIDNQDGTIHDAYTGLVWERKCNCPGDLRDGGLRAAWTFDGKNETIWDWLAAVNSVDGTGLAGHDDWRIPNVKELASLVDFERSGAKLAETFTQSSCRDLSEAECTVKVGAVYWTSTTFADFPAHAYGVDFSTATIDDHLKTTLRAVRAVRGPVQPDAKIP